MWLEGYLFILCVNFCEVCEYFFVNKNYLKRIYLLDNFRFWKKVRRTWHFSSFRILKLEFIVFFCISFVKFYRFVCWNFVLIDSRESWKFSLYVKEIFILWGWFSSSLKELKRVQSNIYSWMRKYAQNFLELFFVLWFILFLK